MLLTADNLLPHHGEVFLYPGFFSKSESDTYLNHLMQDIGWKQEPIKLFGKTIMQPRLTALFGDSEKKYTYSGITMSANIWTAGLMEMKIRVEKITGVTFTGALLNLYRDGNDSMGWHRDNEKELGKFPVIASLSFGAARKFQLREYATKENTRTLFLEHGHLLVMRGETQQYWEHRVPKDIRAPHSRVNITFRILK